MKFHLKEIDRRLSQIEPSKYPLIIYEDQKPEYSPFLRAYVPEGNLDIFTRATPVFRVISTPPRTVTGCSAGCRSLSSAAKISFPPLSIQCAWHYLTNRS